MEIFDLLTSPRPSDGVRMLAITDAPACDGVTDAAAGHVIGVHLGKAAIVRQKREDESFDGLYRHGQLTAIPAGWLTSCWTRSSTSFAHVHLGPDFLARAVEQDRPRVIPRFRFEDPVCRELLLSMLEAARERGEAARLYLETSAVVVAQRLVGLGPPPRARAGLSAVAHRRVTDFMHDHLADTPSVAELAAVAGLSPAHFARMFRASTGTSPHRYLNRIRLERAKALLGTTELRVVEVALAVGFANPSQFAAFFRAGAGVSPRDFRRRSR